jgi:hypothetical protein
MAAEFGKIKLKLYGLPQEKNGAVRADVFAKKLDVLIKGLRAADRHVNRYKSFNYLITNLEYSSALAVIDEVEYNLKFPAEASSVQLLQNVARDVYDGRGISKDLPRALAKAIAEIGDGTEHTFSHGEVSIDGDDDNIVRIDKFFDKRADRAFEEYLSHDKPETLFDGIAMGTFDGVLKEIDLRGTVASAKLILTAGNVELNCVCNSVTVENLREALDKKVSVSAIAHYNGIDHLPEQIEIKKIHLFNSEGHLTKWRGAFDIPPHLDEDVW